VPEPLRIVLMKWKAPGVGFLLPNQKRGHEYGPDHVNIAHAMLKRHLRMPFETVCITDDPAGIDPAIRCIPLWDKCRYLGGCFNRLYVFSADMARFIGPRFACLDLDCVIVDDVTPIFARTEKFIINSYSPAPSGAWAEQLYNGGLFMMDAGARAQVWDLFDYDNSPAWVQDRRDRVGTDQAWIREVLGPDEARFTKSDGVYEARDIGATLPADARLVMFAGARDPSKTRIEWVKENWRL
jgi:hypothetical protein